VDRSNNIVLTGHFWGTVDFGGVSLTSHFSLSYDPDIFVMKLDPRGGTLWAKGGFGSSSYDTGRSVAVDSAGNVYVAGEFDLSVDFGAPTSPLTCNGFPDAFVAKFSSAGDPIWAKNYGDASVQRATSVAVDGNDNPLVSGWFRGGVNLGTGSALTAPAGSSAIFLAKLTTAGVLLWQKAFQDSDELRYPAIAVDSSSNVLLTSNVKLIVDFGSGPLQTTNTNYRDIVVARYRADGSSLWAKRYTGTNESWGCAVAAAGLNPVFTGYIAGSVDFGGGALTNGSGTTHAGVLVTLTP
jgi:hypothetical protein